jgi:ribose 5-phosphate isomerase A
MVSEIERWKSDAAARAVACVAPGMTIGLGHGTTTRYAVLEIAAWLRDGRLYDVRAVPCSRAVETLARAEGIPLTSLEDHPVLDLTIDGADVLTPSRFAIKGGGGALLREKIVAQATRREILIVDATKLSPTLHGPVPLEVVPFGWHTQADYCAMLGGRALRREVDGVPVLTDQGNYLLDVDFGPVADPYPLAEALQARAGIIAHGLFLDLVHEAFVAGADGVRHLRR